MFNNLTCLLVRGITETLKCLNYFILFLVLIGARYSCKNDFFFIAISGIAIYLLATYSITIINEKKNLKTLKFFISIIIELAVGFIGILGIYWHYKIYCTFYFLSIVAYAQIHYNNECDGLGSFLKKYFYSTLFVTSELMWFTGTQYKEVIYIYLPIYIIMSIVYIMQVNVLEEYRDLSANLINESRNINRFSFISLSITVLSFLTFTTNFFGKIYSVAVNVIADINYLILKLIAPIMLWLNEHWFSKTEQYAPKPVKQEEIPETVKKEILKNNELINQNVTDYQNKDHLVGKIILFIILIIVVAVALYFIYKKFMTMEISNSNEEILDGEERSFVFRKSNLEKKKKKESVKNLHVIRKLYIDVVKILEKRGVEYKSSYTPNEYNSFIENTNFKDKNIDELIKMYNGLRYGNRTISKEEINKAYKIKENL